MIWKCCKMWQDILRKNEFVDEAEYEGPMSQKSAAILWEKDNPDVPYSRGKHTYPLDQWFVRILNGKVVGIQGYKDFEDYAYVGGSKSSSTGGLKAFEEYRKKYLEDKPKIAGFNPSTGDRDKYIERMKRYKWTLNPDEFEGVPAEVIQDFKEKYPDGNWGIKKHSNFY